MPISRYRDAVRFLPLAATLATAILALASACGRSGLVETRPAPKHDAGADVDAADAADTGPDVEAGPDVTDGSACESGTDCTSRDFCTVGTCDPDAGCVFAPRSCDDGFACTTDMCSSPKSACVHQPVDTQCGPDQLCSARTSCGSFIYAVASDGHLYEVGIPGGAMVDLGPTQASIGEIAIAPDGTLYGTDSYVLYATDRTDATTTAVGSIMPLHQYSGLGSSPAGALEATCDVPQIFSIDPASAAATPIATIPTGYRSSGDLTSVRLQGMFGTSWLLSLTPTAAGADDDLALQSPGGLAVSLGSTGVECVWGLATLGTGVYGVTCQGLLVSLDTTTGKATTLVQEVPAFEGAAGR
jgi:hypothetical protein